MLGWLVKASALVIGTGLAVTACSVPPLKMGSAAVLGNDRITISTLNSEVTNLSETVKQYPSLVTLTAMQEVQQTLTWLVRYQINDELALQNGITITTAQAEAALAEIYASAKASAEAQGLTNVSLDLILAANGIPPDTAAELGRYQAIETQYVKNVSGGKIPTSTSGQAAASAKLGNAQCQAAKALDIRVNPQFGRMDYSQAPYQVVSAPSTVTGTLVRLRRLPPQGWRPLADRPGDQPAGGARPARLAGLGGAAVRRRGARATRSSPAARA